MRTTTRHRSLFEAPYEVTPTARFLAFEAGYREAGGVWKQGVRDEALRHLIRVVPGGFGLVSSRFFDGFASWSRVLDCEAVVVK